MNSWVTLPGGPSVCSMKSAFIAGSECGDSSLSDAVVEIFVNSPCDDHFPTEVRIPRLTTTHVTSKEKCALLRPHCSRSV